MKRSFTISIEAPCAQSWDEMSPDISGRFCASCQKTVVDFTKFSDAELVAYFQQRKIFGCGRFTEKQLSIPIPQRPKRLTFWSVNKFAAASLIAALGLPFKTNAQFNDVTPTHNTPTRDVDNPIPEKLTVIKGIVKDGNGEGIPGATITVKGTDKGTVSDIDGRFQLELPQQDSAYKLVCDALGMVSQKIIINESGSINIIMENNNIKGQTIMAGGISAQYCKPTLWQRLTKPFRKK